MKGLKGKSKELISGAADFVGCKTLTKRLIFDSGEKREPVKGKV